MTSVLSLGFVTPGAYAQAIAFEGNSLPENDPNPWVRYGTLDAQRWIDNGLFVQLLSQECCPMGFGQNDSYKRTVGEFTGSSSFFVTWRETTNIPRAAISATPNGISIWSPASHDVFQFKVTRDQVEFIRDNPVGLVLDLDIQADVFHTYYLALHTDLSYLWYIDGAVVNSGQYPNAFPDGNALVQWYARYYNDQQTAKWDYVRYGVIPADQSGDFNNNGVVDESDAYFFVDCLLAPDYDAAGPGCKWADMNADGKADGADVQLFVIAMMGS